MEEVIKDIRQGFNAIKGNLQEDNIRSHIIEQIFMKHFGYNTKNYVLEKRIVKGFCDIFIPINNNEALIIEVKNGYNPIIIEDIKQANDYAKSKGQRFAILTNGYEYLLLDSDIKPVPKIEGDVLKSHIVFWFNVFKPKQKGLTELAFFNYLNEDNLFVNRSTHFFCDIAQYREWKLQQGMSDISWNTYRCTLFKFFNYYIKTAPYSKPYGYSGERAYESIDMDVFDGFIKECKREKENTSIKTIESNLSHVYGMLSELQKHKKISHICLNNSRKENLVSYKKTAAKKKHTTMNTEDVEAILTFLETKRNSTRDIVIFMLTITIGLERAQLVNLQWSNFEKDYTWLNIDDRRVELPTRISKYLSKLSEEQKKLKIKSPYLFHVLYRKKYRPIKEWGINDVFNKFAQITNDDKWNDYSPKFVKICLLKTLFCAKYSLDDIIYITGFDIDNISKYITTEEILKRRGTKINWKPLYDGMLCE